jgi:hypothetical protein
MVILRGAACAAVALTTIQTQTNPINTAILFTALPFSTIRLAKLQRRSTAVAMSAVAPAPQTYSMYSAGSAILMPQTQRGIVRGISFVPALFAYFILIELNNN